MLTTVEKVMILRNVELFREIPGEVLSDIAFFVEEVRYEKGDYVVTEGDVGTELFIVVEGALNVVEGNQNVGELTEGSCFGEMAIIDSYRVEASVVVESSARLIRISKNDFQDILVQREEVALGVIRELCRRIRTLETELKKQF